VSERKPGKDSSPKDARRADTGAVLDELERRNRTHSKRRGGSTGVVLLFLLVLALAGGGAWWGWLQWESMQSYETELAAYQSDLARVLDENQRLLNVVEETRESIGRDVDTRLTRLRETETDLQQTVDDFDAVQQREEQRFTRLQQQLGRDMQDVASLVTALQEQVVDLQQRDLGWLVTEADYLMRLAQRKLQLERDVDSSVMLLSTVGDLLRGQMGMLVSTAQRNIERDIETLRQLQLPDRAAIAAQLNELSARLDELVFASGQQQAYQESVQQWWAEDPASGEPATPVPADGEPAPVWLETLTDLLRTIFVWRELDTEQAVFLQPDQEQLLKQQMLLQLEQARLAVVQGDQGMFQATLQQLSRLLERYLQHDNQITRQLLDSIEALTATTVEVELPDLATSVNLVRQLAGSVMLREANTAETGGSRDAAVEAEVRREADAAATEVRPEVDTEVEELQP